MRSASWSTEADVGIPIPTVLFGPPACLEVSCLQGLLAPARRPSGYREYVDEHVSAVRRIRILLAAGLSTAQILTVLPCVVDDEGLLTPDCPEPVDGLVRQRARIDEAIGELRATRANLDTIISRRRRTG